MNMTLTASDAKNTRNATFLEWFERLNFWDEAGMRLLWQWCDRAKACKTCWPCLAQKNFQISIDRTNSLIQNSTQEATPLHLTLKTAGDKPC
jgi:hypothetical protein